MAKAKRLTPKAPKHIVRLDLTVKEAETLRSILHSVGGQPTKSRRKYADRIESALARQVSLPENYSQERTGSIMFLTPDEMASRL